MCLTMWLLGVWVTKMSYIRYNHPLVFVEGFSEDYVYDSASRDNFIEDYGNISDNGFIELLFQEWQTDDVVFKNHLLKRLAERLNVKLRKTPLSDEKYLELDEEHSKQFEKENSELFKK